jgi:hypothetical protein
MKRTDLLVTILFHGKVLLHTETYCAFPKRPSVWKGSPRNYTDISFLIRLAIVQNWHPKPELCRLQN